MDMYLETENVDVDPSTQAFLDKKKEIEERLDKLPLPNVIPEEKAICIYNNLGQKVCYMLPNQNGIQCDSNLCKVNYKTNDRTFMVKKFPRGMHIGLKPNGAFSALHIFGVIDKSELSNVMEMIGDISLSEVNSIQKPSFDLPDPPKSCRWAIWSDKCQPYIKDLNWKWGLFRGWRKS